MAVESGDGEVKRYDLEYVGNGYLQNREMVRDSEGEWVRFEDIAKWVDDVVQKSFATMDEANEYDCSECGARGGTHYSTCPTVSGDPGAYSR